VPTLQKIDAEHQPARMVDDLFAVLGIDVLSQTPKPTDRRRPVGNLRG
jgi:hypothetical protein